MATTLLQKTEEIEVIKRDAEGKYLGIQCDRCDRMAPDAATIQRAHGLNRLGWSCVGHAGTHLCPDHVFGLQSKGK